MIRLLVAAVALAGFTGHAVASTMPARPVLITPTSIDGAKIGAASRGVYSRRADHRYRDPGTRMTELIWWRGKSRRDVYAAQTRAANGRSLELQYWGSFRTAKGDKPGTTLAAFKRHWPKATIVQAGSLRKPKLKTWNAVIRTGKVLAIFNFDARKRLRGLQLGGATDLAEFTRICAYPPDCRR